jgi:mRNA interferase RelE/StbE
MTYQVEISSAARRQIKKLPHDIQTDIILAIEALASNPRPDDVKKLKGEEKAYRIRVKDYRILYDIEDDRLLVIVIAVETVCKQKLSRSL